MSPLCPIPSPTRKHKYVYVFVLILVMPFDNFVHLAPFELSPYTSNHSGIPNAITLEYTIGLYEGTVS